MLRAVVDTHAIIWYIFGDRRLSITAQNAIAIPKAPIENYFGAKQR
jgi:PIN domain nuclease of toxin-antitoxin system